MGERQRERYTERIRMTASQVGDLGQLVLRFADELRAPYRADGRQENDVEHSYMLSIVAPSLAQRFYPKLDVGKVTMFSIIHDLPEVITGDTPSFILTTEERLAKEAAEAAAVEELLQWLPEPWNDFLKRYQGGTEPEARFACLVDKLMPAVLQMHGDGRKTFQVTYGIDTAELIEEQRSKNAARLREKYPEFPEIHDVMQDFWDRTMSIMFPPSSGTPAA